MTETVSLHRLVSRCMQQDVAPKTFISLFNQLNQANAPNDNEYVTELLEIQPPKNYDERSQISLKTRLVLELSLSNDVKLSQFWRCLAITDLTSQIIYLRRFNILINKFIGKIDKVILKLLLNIHFSDYILTIIAKLPEDLSKSQQELLYCIVIIGGQLYDKLSYMMYKDDEKLQQVINKLSNKLTKSGLNDLNQLWIDLIKKLIKRSQYSKKSLITSNNNEALSDNKKTKSASYHLSSKSLLLTNISQDKHDQFILMKEYFWFLRIMKFWKFPQDDSTILNVYLQNFVSIKDRKNSYLITRKILKINFIGITFAIINNDCDYILYNWKNFIVSRLPKLFINLRFNEDENFEKAIIDTFNSFTESTVTIVSDIVIGNKNQYDLRQCFIKSCILNKLITMHSFQKIFPLDSKTNQQILVNELGQANHELHLQQKFQEKLLNINPEFVSLEESELIEYINSLLIPLEYSDLKQQEFSKLILKIIQDLIIDKNNEKLFRLLISLLNNVTILKLVIFNLGSPYKLLNPLIDYLDIQPFNCEDEENFQDQYSYFGVILLTIISIVDIFKLDINKIVMKNSFVIDYINNFYFSLGDNLTNQLPSSCNDEDKTIGGNYANLLSEWINALFDDDNDGLSDDLIKSITIKQIYKLIPIVYQQAVLACRLNKINLTMLTGGIDYLTQMFLIPCTISIINWLLNEMLVDKYNSESIAIKVLNEIIKSNLGDDSSDNDTNKLIFKNVLRISGSNILQSLKSIQNWEKSTTIKNIVNMITKQISFEYVGTDKSFKNNISPDINIDQEIRKSFIEGTKRDKVPIATLDIQFINQYMVNNKNEFVKIFLNEINIFQKTNNEDSKILINIGVFLVINYSINSNEEKNLWLDILCDPPKETQSEVGGNQQDQFELTMDYHYSSIFDDNNSKNYDKDEDMFGDFIEDDDLFTDKKIKPTSIILQKLLQEYEKHENFLTTLQSLRYQYHENHRLYKPIILFTDKVIEELTNLTW